jgi:hypothetical protein
MIMLKAGIGRVRSTSASKGKRRNYSAACDGNTTADIDCIVPSYYSSPGSSALSGFGHRAVVVAVTVVEIMKVSIDQIVNVVSMRHRFMSAVRSMHML